MNKRLIVLAGVTLIGAIALSSCATTEPETPQASPASEQVEPAASEQTTGETGTLQIYANGEDFVRQGFVSRDGWDISFDHVYANLADVTAYQTDPPFDPDASEDLQGAAKDQVGLEGVKTVDLAEGGDDADPILIGETQAPPGRYNALSWAMVSASEGPASGAPLLVQGTATKDGQTVDFVLNLGEEMRFQCGEYVGDERKGILEPGDTAELEATFHFDHLFGDGEAPADDPINTGALGFDPFARLAQNGQLEADMATLRENLSEEEYAMLQEILPGLSHVGEGHCNAIQSTT